MQSLYVMVSNDGLVKIGRSKDPYNRAKVLGSDDWGGLRSFVVKHVTAPVENAHAVERQAQKIMVLSAEHIGHELFKNGTIEQAIQAIETATRQLNGLELPLAGRFNGKEGALRRARARSVLGTTA